MKKITVLTLAILNLGLFSCKEKTNQTTEVAVVETTAPTAEASKQEKLTDKNGNILETIAFSEQKNTLTLKLNEEVLEMVGVPAASGSHFKNEHYTYTLWHGKTIIEKDGKVVFEAGEETMPK